MSLRVEWSRGAVPPPMTLLDQLTPLMFFVALMMGMFMPNFSFLLMSILQGPFGCLRPLLLTREDPFVNGYLNPSIDLMQVAASGGGSWILDSGATSHMTESK